MKRLSLLLGIILLLGMGLSSATLNNADAYWAFDTGSGTSAVDSSGNGVTGTLNGAAWSSSAAAKLGNSSLVFDGVSDYVGFGNTLSAVGASSDDPISFMGWVDVSTWNQRGTILSRYTGSGQREYSMLIYDNRLFINFYNPTGTAFIGRSAPVSGQPTNNWVHIAVTYDGSETSAGLKIYVNNVRVDDTNSAGGTYTGMSSAATAFQLGTRYDGLNFTGGMDEWAVYPRELPVADINESYNAGAGLNPYSGNLTYGQLSFNATDVFGDVVNDFNVTIGGVTENSSFEWNLSVNNYTATFSKDGWYDLELDVEVVENTTSNYTFEDAYNHILELAINDLSGVGNPNVFSVNVTNSDYPSWSEFVSVDANTTQVNVTLPATTAYTASSSFVLMATLTPNLEDPIDPVLVEMYSSRGHASSTCEIRTDIYYVNGTTQQITDSYGNVGSAGTSGAFTTGFDEQIPIDKVEYYLRKTAGGGSGCRLVATGTGTYITVKQAPAAFLNLLHGNYTVDLDSTNWVRTEYNVTLSDTANFTFYEMDAYANPSSVSVTIRDAANNNLITGEVNLTVNGESTQTTYNTTDGTIYVEGLAAGNYSFRFEADNYTSRTYIITAGARSTQTLTAYLTTSTDVVLFTIIDSSNDNPVSNAAVTMQSYVNGSLVTVQSALTDIAGQAAFYYTENLYYQFTITKDGYTTNQFVLDPIQVQPGQTVATYRIRLDPEATLTDDTHYAGYNVVFTPKQYYSNTSYNVTFTFTSPSGSLQTYNATVCLLGSCNEADGNNAQGSTLTIPISTVGAEWGDSVDITYTVLTANEEVQTASFTYLIDVDVGSSTFQDKKCPSYGLGYLECALIGTVVVMLPTGAVALYAGAGPATAVALLFMGISVHLGLFTLWAVLISMLLGFVIMVWRSG